MQILAQRREMRIPGEPAVPDLVQQIEAALEHSPDSHEALALPARRSKTPSFLRSGIVIRYQSCAAVEIVLVEVDHRIEPSLRRSARSRGRA